MAALFIIIIFKLKKSITEKKIYLQAYVGKSVKFVSF